MIPNTRPAQWMKAARQDFEAFPKEARDSVLDALTFVAAGGFPRTAKPLKGFGSGVFELALRHHKDAFRVVYVVRIGADIWVLHAFQKKSKSGIEAPKADIDLMDERIKQRKKIVQ